ncbi:unnamed protein product [Rotaria sp. Silwood2]|nr:unnamed protein product [Rotaria sp. Silwood2]CAF4406141.1 unnamed protein product [Rotaria sp. Silwood2]CAF4416410.1 unnamed protein product [Rotaria sp. Silwood2]
MNSIGAQTEGRFVVLLEYAPTHVLINYKNQYEHEEQVLTELAERGVELTSEEEERANFLTAALHQIRSFYQKRNEGISDQNCPAADIDLRNGRIEDEENVYDDRNLYLQEKRYFDEVPSSTTKECNYSSERVTAVSPSTDPSSAAPPVASSLLSYQESKSASAWIDSPVFLMKASTINPAKSPVSLTDGFASTNVSFLY